MLIVADVRIYREGLSLVISAKPNMSVIGSVSALGDVPDDGEPTPDVIVYDTAIRREQDTFDLRRLEPRAHILAIGVRESEHEIAECAAAGVTGFVNRDATLDELIAVIESVAQGRAAASSGILHALLRRSKALSSPTSLERLTSREREVVHLLERGLSNKEIAHALSIEISTVKNHVHSVLEKLNLRRRAEIGRASAVPGGQTA